MTQPLTSDDGLPVSKEAVGQDKPTEAQAESSGQPAIVHPNFDPKQTPLDPARSLQDIPEPARRMNRQLRRLYGQSAVYQPSYRNLSKWQLVASEPFAEHLALLQAAKLIELPDSFYHNHSSQSLLSSLEPLLLLDMADIQSALSDYPALTRYGFVTESKQPESDQTKLEKAKSDNTMSAKANDTQNNMSLRAVTKRYDPDELLSSAYADDWQVILQPQDFDSGLGSLSTDIMACSVAVQALKQCDTRQSINTSYCATDICQHVRSYLLSQITVSPARRDHYRQIRLFAGHIIVAAHYLGWDIQVRADGECCFNLSSRCGLLTRYANMQDYHINGWSS